MITEFKAITYHWNHMCNTITTVYHYASKSSFSKLS